MMPDKPVNVLVVEDGHIHALLIRHAFKNSSDRYNLTMVESLEQARASIDANVPDLVLADIYLPDGLGTDLLPKEGHELSYPIMVMTCQGNEQVAVEAMKAGALDYLIKSNDIFMQMPRIAERVLREWDQTVKRRQAEEQLHFKTALLEAQTEVTIDGILIVNDDRKCVMHNRRFEEMWRIPQDVLDSQDEKALMGNMLSLLSDADGFVRKADYLHVHGDEKSRDEIELKDGRVFDQYSAPLNDAFGRHYGRIWFFRDISNLKQVEKELKESEGKYRALFECSRDAMMTIAPPSWKFTSCNPACLEMFGAKDEDEFTSLGPWDVSPTNQPDGQASVPKAKESIETAVTEGSCYFEWTHKRLNGEEFPATVMLTRVEMNGQTVVQATVRDEADRIKREHDLAGLAAIIKQASELVMITNLQGVIEYVNPAFEMVSGFSARELEGQDMRILFAEDQQVKWHEELETAIARGEVWCGRVLTNKKDGSLLNQDIRIWSIRDSSDIKSKIVSIGRDISQQLALETQLRQAQKLESIGQMAAGIAHEINTPMQYVGDNTNFLREGFTEIVDLIGHLKQFISAAKGGNLTDDLVGEVDKAIEKADLDYLTKEIPKAFEQSLDGISRVTKIVRAMKEFSHPGSETAVATDINRAIESTVTVSRNEWKYAADLEMELDPELPLVPCFPGELNQALLNLITNAAHAIKSKLGENSAQKGQITVSTKHDGAWAEIRIGDTGTGIPEKIREKVFDPFFTTKEIGKGTGQGLSICHAVIVEKHKGSIIFESEEGVGTTFIIRLPIDSGNETEETESDMHISQVS
jgi:PAS domain S-box-containing protein